MWVFTTVFFMILDDSFPVWPRAWYLKSAGRLNYHQLSVYCLTRALEQIKFMKQKSKFALQYSHGKSIQMFNGLLQNLEGFFNFF